MTAPQLTEQQIALVTGALRSEDPEERALAISELLCALMPNTAPDKFSLTVKGAKDWQNANAFIYEAIGGMFRHALWADQNPDRFYDQLGRTFAAAQTANVLAQGNITVVSAVPDSPLNVPPPVRSVDVEVTEVEDDDF